MKSKRFFWSCFWERWLNLKGGKEDATCCGRKSRGAVRAMSQHMPPLWQGAALSGFSIMWIILPGNSAEGVLKWSPLVHPCQTPLSWHFRFSLSELSALLCWLRLCRGSGLSLVLKRAGWPCCMALLSCWDNCGHCGLVVPHWGECIGKCWNLCIFWCENSSVISCLGHQGTYGTLSVWGSRSLLWKERAEAH